jgi:hypothetical protein
MILPLATVAFAAGHAGAAAAGAGIATYYATVTGSGTVTNSSGVHAASHPSVGVYNLTFNRANTGCAYLAAVTGTDANVGFAVAERVDATNFTVRTYNGNSSALASLAFNLIVSCAN